jgi:predicted O-methyltransferase YrrM
MLNNLKGNLNRILSRSKLTHKIWSDAVYKEQFSIGRMNTNELRDILLKNYPLKYICPNEILDLLALNLQSTVKKNSLNWVHGYILYSFINDYMDKNSDKFITFLETGTARGFSATLVHKILNMRCQNFQIITIDLIGHHEKRYWNSLGDSNGRRTRKELIEFLDSSYTKNIFFLKGKSVKQIQKLNLDRINIAFVDSVHDYATVIEEFRSIKRSQRLGDIIIFDDVVFEKYPGVFKAINEIKSTAEYNVKLLPLSSSRGFAIARRI